MMRCALVSTLAIGIAVGTASAQALVLPAVVPAVRNACLDRVPASVMQPVPVFLSPNLVGASKPYFELHDHVDHFARSVAQTAQALLGAANAALPAGEPHVTWRSLEADVHVVVRRDGSIAWRLVPDDAPGEERLDDAGALLVGRAIDTLRARGEHVTFPDGFALDSAELLLQIKPSFRDEHGTVTKQKMRAGFPIFSVLMPSRRSPRADRLRVRYPDIVRQQGFTGQVVMLFMVDTTGRVVRSSIRDERPAGSPAFGAKEQAVYATLVRSTGAELARAIYRPAQIGDCLVTANVRQQFTFALDDGLNGR